MSLARRTAFSAGFIVVCVALQFSVVNHLGVHGVGPDLPLVATLVIGLFSGPRAGMALGFSAGVIEGALLGYPIFVRAAAKTITGYLAGSIGRRVFPENLLVVMAVCATLTLVQQAFFAVASHAAGDWATVSDALGRAVYNGIVALVMGAALRPLRGWLPEEEVGA